MKNVFLLSLAAAAATMAAQGEAPSTTHYRLAGAMTAAGGGPAASPHYSARGRLGDLTGAPAASIGGAYASSPSWPGGTPEIVTVEFQAEPDSVDEGQTTQLSASAVLDDDTTLALAADDVAWLNLGGPIESIDAAGLALAGIVYQDETASIEGAYAGHVRVLRLTVRNVGQDDYGRYAGDGLADHWQVRHFGENNAEANPQSDPDDDHQNNEFEETAGTDPNDPRSRFDLIIVPVAEAAGQKHLVFGPVFADRVYSVEYKSNLADEDFAILEKQVSEDIDGDRVVTDLDATDPARYYRVRIEKQP